MIYGISILRTLQQTEICRPKIRAFAENNNALIKKYEGNGAKAALEEGFVTDIASVDEFAANIGFADSKTFSVTVNTIGYDSYNANFAEMPSQNSIGVIHINGAISSTGTGRIDDSAVSYKIVDLLILLKKIRL